MNHRNNLILGLSAMYGVVFDLIGKIIFGFAIFGATYVASVLLHAIFDFIAMVLQ